MCRSAAHVRPYRRRLAVAVAAAVAGGLVFPAPSDARGRPTPDGYPSDAERSLFVVTNAARTDPFAFCALCGNVCGGDLRARPPLVYDHRLGRASRFHARHMHDTPCFQHDSCCVLERRVGQVRCTAPAESGCTGCNRTECAGTDPWQRMALFDYAQGSGENIAGGSGSAMATLCQWMGSDGHRRNILSTTHQALGTGAHFGEGCMSRYWVQNFGRETPPPVGSPIAAGGLVDGAWFAAVFHDPAGDGPARAQVAVGEACHDLTLTWGTEALGTWLHEPDAGPGACTPYWFVFVDGGGQRWTYPGTGALVAGGEDCDGWVDARPTSACDACDDGETERCYDGPVGTEGRDGCAAGVRTCEGGRLGPCVGQVVPDAEGVCRAGLLAGCGCIGAGTSDGGRAAGVPAGFMLAACLVLVAVRVGRRRRSPMA